jgi:transcriptional regulator with XRE-family HTH domain
MPQKSRLQLPPIDLGKETIGERIAIIRRQKKITQKSLAIKMGLLNYLISDYERGRRRLYDEMVARFAIALEVSADYLLGLKDDPEPLPKKK